MKSMAVPFAIATIVLLSLSPAAADDVPLFGRPSVHYYDAIGEQIRVEMSAAPTDVRVEQELALTVRVTGAANPRQVRRPDLRAIDDFAARFHVDDLDDGPAPATADRVFRYKLRPKNESVKEVPPLLFRYWQPQLKYFAATSPEAAIPLTVRPRESSDAVAVPLQGPEFLFHLTDRHDVPAPTLAPAPVSDVVPFFIFLAPLAACFAWYLWWLRHNPGAAQLAQYRRFRAVRAALDELNSLQRKPDGASVGRIAALVRTYLCERWNLPSTATTPSEVEGGLKNGLLSTALMEQTTAFFRSCDVARFGPVESASFPHTFQSDGLILASQAKALIQDLERHASQIEKSAPSNRRTAIAGLAIIMTLGLVLPMPAFADGYIIVAKMIEDAHASFRAGVAARDHDETARLHFRQAAQKYYNLRVNWSPRVWLYRNEGHARLLSGDLAHALLVYREGLFLYPEDEILNRGLEYARSQVQYATPEDKLTLRPHTDRFAWTKRPLRDWGIPIAFILSCVGWMGLTRWLMVRIRWNLVMGLLALAMAAALTTSRFLEQQQREDEYAMRVASPVKPVTLRQGDGPSFMPARDTPLPAGVEVKVIRDRFNWVQVELADGTTGWLPREAMVTISPSRYALREKVQPAR